MYEEPYKWVEAVGNRRQYLDDQFKQGHGFTRSLLSAYSAVLASPGFVFVEEKPGRLDDHALATRLALFLWNSVPDDTLRTLADRGEPGKPDVPRASTDTSTSSERGIFLV